jgi:hypothetical protein
MKIKNLFLCIFLMITCPFLLSCDRIEEFFKTKNESDFTSRTEIEIRSSTIEKENTRSARSDLGNAIVFLYQKDVALALKFAKSARDAEPRNPYVLFAYAEVQAANGDTAGAIKTIEGALKNGFDNRELLLKSPFFSGMLKQKSYRELLLKNNIAVMDLDDPGSVDDEDDEDVVRAGSVEIRIK